MHGNQLETSGVQGVSSELIFNNTKKLSSNVVEISPYLFALKHDIVGSHYTILYFDSEELSLRDV